MTTLEEIHGHGADADDVLRDVVHHLASLPEIAWAGVSFREGEELVLGPQAGTADETRRVRTTIAYDGVEVGELGVDGTPSPELLERVAAAIAPYVLLGWDTGGEAWEP